MPWKYTDEYYREYTRTTWNESADAWLQLQEILAPFRDDLVAALAPRAGERVLDLATGQGEPALSIAAQVGPTGHVTGVDLSERMIAIAQRSAQERKASNTTFRTMDCAKLDLPSGGFDAVVSSLGFQIFTDPEAAAKEAYRVLRPDGRISVSVWGTGEKVPFLDVIVGPMLELAEPDETGYIPSPYETGGPGEMVDFLAAAGFRDGREVRRSYTFHIESPEAYIQSVLEGTPIGHSLREETPEVQADVLQKTRANLARWTGPTGVDLPAEGVVVVAHK